MKPTRRLVLQTIGTGVVGAAGIGRGIADTTNTEDVTVTGRLVAHSGEVVSMGQVRLLAADPETEISAWVNDDGWFEASVPSDNQYRIGYYKYNNPENELVPVKNGVPHVDKFHPFGVNQSDRELGEIQMPKPYMVNVRILKENGEPETSSEVSVHIRADGLGKGDTYPTDSNGYVYIPGASFTGFELGGDLVLTVTLPSDAGSVEFQKELLVEQPVTMTVQRGEGVTVTESYDGTPSTPTEYSTPTATTTPTTTQVNTGGPTVTEGYSESTSQTEASNELDTPDNRGFFANDAGESGPLSDVMNLTVLGFLLSVGGILHQMLEGR